MTPRLGEVSANALRQHTAVHCHHIRARPALLDIALRCGASREAKVVEKIIAQ
jgi:hypothetical protein